MGVDIITDGEITRPNYIHHHCKYMTGFDSEKMFKRTFRNGTISAELPSIISKVETKELYAAREW